MNTRKLHIPDWGSPVVRAFLTRAADKSERSEFLRLWLPPRFEAERTGVHLYNNLPKHVIAEIAAETPRVERTRHNLFLLQRRLVSWVQGIAGVEAWLAGWYDPKSPNLKSYGIPDGRTGAT